MCFLAVLRLAKVVNEEMFAKILRDIGYYVDVREIEGKKIIEARKGDIRAKASIHEDKIRVKTNDYGPQCLRDLDELYKALYENDLKPDVIEIVSPYVYVFEKRRRKAKKILEELGLEAEEVYEGYCG